MSYQNHKPIFDPEVSERPGEFTFGKYQVLGKLGHGGMGVVYRARDPELNREVALKLLPSVLLTTPEQLTRFQREAEAAAAVDHPNIIPVYQVGEIEDQPYMVMRLIEGSPLSEYEESLRGDYRRICSLVAKIARAVQAAHARGILHRDLKPSNILIEEKTGEPQVGDFGIARILDKDETGDIPRLTLTGEVLGTPEFMSPEQAAGKPVTQACDIYSLGVILYRLLCGKDPIHGVTLTDLLRNIAEQAPGRMEFAKGKPDKDLEAITMKCLEKNPAHRYDSAAALADDLERWLRREPILARNPAAPERLIRWARRRPIHAAAAGLATAFFLTLAIGGPLVALNQNRLTTEANTQREKAERSAAEFRRGLYNAEMRAASRAAHEPGGLTVIDNLTSKWADADDLTGWEWHYLRGRLDQPFEIFAPSTTKGNGELAVSSDGKYLAAKLDDRGVVSLLDAVSGESILEFSDTTNWNATNIRFSLDNTRILIGAQHPMRFGVFSIEDGRKLFGGGSGQQTSNEMAFTPDGRFVIQGSNGWFRIYRASDGQVVAENDQTANPASLAVNPVAPCEFLAAGWRGKVQIGRFDEESGILDFEEFTTAGAKIAVHEVDWSPDGGHIVLINSPDYSVSVLDAKTFDFIWTSNSAPGPLHSVSYHPDGKYVATGGADRSIRIYDSRTGTLLSTLRGHTSTVHQIAWHPDGTKLYSGSADGTHRVWDTSGIDGTLDLPFRKYPIFALAWGNDGLLVAGNGLHANVWRVRPEVDREPVYTLKNLYGKEVSIHPDGDRIAAPTRDHLRIYSVRDGTEIQSFNLVNAEISNDWRSISEIRWSPDGEKIAFGLNYSDYVYVVPAELKQPNGRHLRINAVSDNISSWCWAPDSSAIISVRDRTRLLRHPLDGEPKQPLAETTDTILYLAFDPKHRWLALSGENVIELRDVDDFTLRKTMVGHSSSIIQVAWAPDGRRLASLEQSGVLGIWDPETGEAVSMLESPNGERYTAIAWSPDGEILAAGDATTEVHLLEGK